MADSDITTLFGSGNADQWPEQDRAAFSKGYDDYLKQVRGVPVSILRPVYDPPAGAERAYQAGWDKAKADDDRRQAELAILLS